MALLLDASAIDVRETTLRILPHPDNGRASLLLRPTRRNIRDFGVFV
jgi:hypothetical protein